MKIGIITIYNVPNYGSVLQTFATQKVLMNMGHECVVVKYNYRNDAFFTKQGLHRNRFKEWALLHFPFLKSAKLHKFRKRHIIFTRKFDNYSELEEYDWTGFDAFIVGSDQVWNTNYLFGDPSFLLKFIPDHIAKISYSSSFAMQKLPDEFIGVFKTELKKFKALSVREQNGIDIIKNDLRINKNVKLTIDPTLLLSQKDWLSTIPRSSFKKKRTYILVYMWTYAFEPRPYILRVIEHFKKKMIADVIVLEGHRELKDLQCTYIDANRSSISEFFDLFTNADLVITSSFHGTAFALNFGIPLLSIVPNGNADDRQSCLLKLVGAENSIVRLGMEINKINPNYDIEEVHNRIEFLRRDSIDWIKMSLI